MATLFFSTKFIDNTSSLLVSCVGQALKNTGTYISYNTTE